MCHLRKEEGHLTTITSVRLPVHMYMYYALKVHVRICVPTVHFMLKSYSNMYVYMYTCNYVSIVLKCYSPPPVSLTHLSSIACTYWIYTCMYVQYMYNYI